MSAVLGALVLLPALSGAALLVAGRGADRVAGPLAVAVAAAGVVVAALVAGTRPLLSVPFLGIVEGGDLRLVVDGLSAVLVVLVAGIALLVTVFAVVDLPADAARGRFFGYLLLFVAAMLATVTAATLPTLLLAWEVMGATSYALIGYHWDEPGKPAAGTRAFVTTRAGDLGLYVAAGAALAATGSLVLTDLESADGGWADVAAAGVLVAALGKSAQLPFSAWLSAAMQGPSPVSALLHSATMVAAGGYLLIRMQPLLASTGWAATAAAWAGALTAMVLGAVAVAQTDLKQLLAASTAAQIGFVVLAAGVGATAGGTAQLVAHAAVKAGLFVAAGAWLTALGTKNLTDLRGAARRYRGIGAAATVAALALAGVPPLSLWATKDKVLAGVDGTALHVVGLAAAAVSAVYAGRILAVVLARPAGDEEEPGTRRVPALTTVVAGVLAVFAAGLGVLALPAVAERLEAVLDVEGEPSPGLGELLLSGALALVALGLTVAVVRARPAVMEQLSRSPLASWAGLGRLLSPRPAMALARALATVDDRVIDRAVVGVAVGARRLAGMASRADDGVLDGAVSGVAAATRRTAAGSARIDTGVVDGAVRGMARAFRHAGGAARRPQTGLLHQYYAQAVVGLGLLLVLLLVVR
ncbi:NADH-quinone oxidoreductase subunit L [Blastococcus sp. MG754426]|uniref:proton-conducting transporter transmembrane domain-containing protein n=1 Tax=unclassified Blastococcus TaxID=2619396 RepID=UPI001EF0F699|nr:MULTISPECIES: proton-conducting transporter membrane subunit [unclassified Blastococcus]MCF6509972.1 NADH-quinone oxidoreductase subunit L [Blastococcus sp. MG754426]MCF6514358.1 NADH-quinone oxidoreductase subunit L [Blastococcus sp. MG754427]MCF6736115.1 NADH-quinone oxidoreductase subunit L [Blastococcus sp. KM273129]